MKSFAAAVTLFALVPHVLGLTIDSPVNIVQCQPIQLTWHDGTPPYFLSLVPAQQPSAPPIKQFPTQTGTSLTWLVDLQANTIFNIALKDNTGATAFSSMLTVLAGSDSSCLSTAVTIAGSGGATASSGASTDASAASSTGAAASSGGSSATPTKGSSAASTTATSKPNGAAGRFTSVGAFGIAGLMGLIGAALF